MVLFEDGDVAAKIVKFPAPLVWLCDAGLYSEIESEVLRCAGVTNNKAEQS